jgi:hypothetical protein
MGAVKKCRRFAPRQVNPTITHIRQVVTSAVRDSPSAQWVYNLYWRGCFAKGRDTKRMATSPDYLKLVESKTRALADAASNSRRKIVDAVDCRLKVKPKPSALFPLHCTSNAIWEHALTVNLSLPFTHTGFSLRCVEGFRPPTSPYRLWDCIV